MQIANLNPIHTLTLAVVALQMAFAGTAVSQDAESRKVTHRKFAPGVLNEIDSQLDARDSYSLPMPLPGVNAEKYELQTDSADQTLHGMSKRVILFRDVYQYDFSFTGLRQIRATVTDAEGIARAKNIWYMIYRVRDLGETLSYEEVQKDPAINQITHELKRGEPLNDSDRLFLPRFSLEGWVFNPIERRYKKVIKRDSVSPAIVRAIRAKEDPRMELLDGWQMSKAEIPKVKRDSDVSVWDDAVWEDINPNLDYVSVFVSGLTNARRIKRNEDDSIGYVSKTLQLNFWRPGDDLEEEKDRIKFGIPLVDDPAEQILITRRYALPGPVIRAYERDQTADRRVLIMETDGLVNMKDFKSALSPILDKGNLPTAVIEAFTESGFTVDSEVGVDTLIEGKKWAFKQGKSDIELVLEPQFWEPDFGGIRFIKSLDSIWIYR